MRDAVLRTSAGEIALSDSGGGTPSVLFLHGAGMNLAEWDAVRGALAPSVRTVAVDLPGHGKSGRLDCWDWDAVDAMVDDLIGAVADDDVVIVGHSLGGIIGMH